MLAHGGTAGAVAEVMFLVVPVGLFWTLSRWAKRRAPDGEAEGDGPSTTGDRPTDRPD